MTDTAVYAVSRNAYNAALSDDATSVTFPAPVRMTESTVVYRLTREQAADMARHMFVTRDILKEAGDAYSSQQARSLDRAATKISRILANQPVAETTAADTDENNAMRNAAPSRFTVRWIDGRGWCVVDAETNDTATCDTKVIAQRLTDRLNETL